MYNVIIQTLAVFGDMTLQRKIHSGSVCLSSYWMNWLPEALRQDAMGGWQEPQTALPLAPPRAICCPTCAAAWGPCTPTLVQQKPTAFPAWGVSAPVEEWGA